VVREGDPIPGARPGRLAAMSQSLVAVQAIHPYAVGGITLGILLFFLVALLMFGAGRDHS
jgi:hypothetical protein